MYIQDEKQRILGNLDIVGKWGEAYDTSQMWTSAVILPQVGAYVKFRDESYVIISVTTYQEKLDPSDTSEKEAITVMCRILRITDEGDDAGEPLKTVHSYHLSLI